MTLKSGKVTSEKVHRNARKLSRMLSTNATFGCAEAAADPSEG